MKNAKKILSVFLICALMISASALLVSASAMQAAPVVLSEDGTPQSVTVVPDSNWRPYYQNDEPAEKTLFGDANCDLDINIKDATAVQKHIASIELLSVMGAVNADVDYNSDINIKDATLIQKLIADIVTDFPADRLCNLTYEIIPEEPLEVEVCSRTETTLVFNCVTEGFYEFYSVSDTDAAAYLYKGDEMLDYSFEFGGEPGFDLYYRFTPGEYSFVINGSEPDTESIAVMLHAITENYPIHDLTSAQKLEMFSEVNMPASTGMAFSVFECTVPGDIEDMVVIMTEGDADTIAYLYDDTFALKGIFDGDGLGGKNISVGLSMIEPNGKIYIAVGQMPDDNGNFYDYKLCVSTVSTMLLSGAIPLTLDSEQTVELAEVEMPIEGTDITTVYCLDGFISFTPSVTGYYKLNTGIGSGICSILVSFGPKAIDNISTNMLGSQYFEGDGGDLDASFTEYMVAGETYYFSTTLCSFVPGSAKLSVTAASKADYDDCHEYYDPDPVFDTSSAVDIATGTITPVRAASTDEEGVLLRLIVDNDGKLVVYSEGNADPDITVMDFEGNLLTYNDDISFENDLLNFAVCGDVCAGDELYFSITNLGDTDIFTVRVVDYADYTPIVIP